MPVEQFQITFAAPAFELTFCVRPHGTFDLRGALLCARQRIDDPQKVARERNRAAGQEQGSNEGCRVGAQPAPSCPMIRAVAA